MTFPTCGLLTEDKDFGELHFARAKQMTGVVLLRYPASARQVAAQELLQLVERHGDRLAGCFAVLQPGRARLVQRRE